MRKQRKLIGFDEILNKTLILIKRCYREILISHAVLFTVGFAAAAARTGEPISKFFTEFLHAFIFIASLAAVAQITTSYAKRKPPGILRGFWKKRAALAPAFGLFAAFFSLNAALSLLIELDPAARYIATPLRVLLGVTVCYFIVNYSFIFQTIFYTDLDFSEALKKSKEIAGSARLVIIGRALTLLLIYLPGAVVFFTAVYIYPLYNVFAAALLLSLLTFGTFFGCAGSVMFLYLRKSLKSKRVSNKNKSFQRNLSRSGAFPKTGESVIRSEKLRKNPASGARSPH